MSISPQGYTYGKDPTSDNPFWTDEDMSDILTNVTASASVDNTTGAPKVDVTRSVSGDTVNFDYAFSGLKGETGATGATGATGDQGEGITRVGIISGTNDPDANASVTVEKIYDASTETNPTGNTKNNALLFTFNNIKGKTGETGATGATGETGATGADGKSPEVVSTGSTESGAVAGTITGADGTTISVYNGAKGETGPAGSTAGVVTDVSVENTNGVYTVSQTKDGTKTDIGSIEVPSIDNVLAEVTDSVVETTSGNYQNDHHTIKETEHNGTQNDVGTFRIARNQITQLNSDGSYHMIDQSGNESDGQINLPSEGGWTTTTLGAAYTNKNAIFTRINETNYWGIMLSYVTAYKTIIGDALTGGIYVETTQNLTGNIVISNDHSKLYYLTADTIILEGLVESSDIDRISAGAFIRVFLHTVGSGTDANLYMKGCVCMNPTSNYNGLVIMRLVSSQGCYLLNGDTNAILQDNSSVEVYSV